MPSVLRPRPEAGRRAGEKAQATRTGDVVWIGPHERHWHGGTTDSHMIHMVTSIGKSTWAVAVSQQDYGS
ncbi:MAG: hypothetical protein O3A06_10990 [Proteobacteria bacterium]|nr:hypothetical protein [Pseudomonadota bacterium]